ncbi:MAG TPA: ATP-binding protein [Tepidisphaeraceae bacterium]|jgi:C4-dicarboxylate-specific signal transduction histidine kinase
MDRAATNGEAETPQHGRKRRAVVWGLLLAAAFAPIALLGARSYQVAAGAVRGAVNQSNASAATVAMAAVRRDLERGVQLAETTARLPAVIDAIERHDEEGVRAYLRAACDPSMGIDRGYVTDPNGLLWSDYPRAPESLGRNFAHLDWYRQMFPAGRSVVSAVYQRNAQPRPLVVALAAPVRKGDRIIGAIVYQYRLDEISRRLAQIDLGAGGHVYVVDYAGTLAAHPMLIGQPRRYDGYASADPVRRALTGEEAPTVTYTDPASGRQMVATARAIPVYGRSWVVVAQQPTEQAYAMLHSVALRIGLAAAILAAASIAVVVALGRANERNRRLNEQLEVRNRDLERLAGELRASVATEQQARTELQTTHDRLKQTQSQLVQSEKLASLGQLVAGVAHEINNPLAFVSNNLAVLQRDTAELRNLLGMYREGHDALEERRPELLRRIGEFAEQIDLEYLTGNLDDVLGRSREGLRRIQQIVKDLREFSQQEAIGEFQAGADVNAGIRSTINIVHGRAHTQRVTIEPDLGDVPPITCQPAKLNQLVLNLLTNAIDACAQQYADAEETAGKVTVRTRPAADGVEIQVSDNGCGIDPAYVSRLFDPFFTTKPPGQGTGLGLSMSQRIVLDHGGRIEVESKAGEGSRFTVFLPTSPPRTTADRGAGPKVAAAPLN